MQLDIGKAHDSEMNFVRSSWKQSALDAPHNDPYKSTGMVGAHFTRYNRDVQRAIDSNPLVLVAREPTDPRFIYGWLAVGLYGNELAILYAYTKYKFRRLGIMRELRDRVLDLAPEDAQLVYCARSVRDPVFERWGFDYRSLNDVLGVTSDEQGAER